MFHRIATLTLLVTLVIPAMADERGSDQRAPVAKKTADPLPDGAQRFNGMLVGRLVSKDVEQGTFIINVEVIPRIWRNSKAKHPKSIVGKNILVDGVSGKWLDALLLIKPGETMEVEARHDGEDHLTFPGELLRKTAPFKPEDYPTLPDGFRGFNGAVVAKIVRKDPELLEMIIEVQGVLETWKDSQAKDPQSIVGKPLMLAGFWQRKEAYHQLGVGDRIEVGLQHISKQSDHISVAEFVRKSNAKAK